MSLLRPNTALVERKSSAAVDQTGEPKFTTATVQANLPCCIDPVDVASRMGGDIQFMVEGVVTIQTDVLFVDGLMPYQFAGHIPGDVVTLNGIAYIVAPNGQGAYPDVQVGDRITDETATTYLVLARAEYFTVNCSLQARLQRGRAW